MQPYEPNPGPLAVDVTDMRVLLDMSQLCGEAWKRLMGSRPLDAGGILPLMSCQAIFALSRGHVKLTVSSMGKV